MKYLFSSVFLLFLSVGSLCAQSASTVALRQQLQYKLDSLQQANRFPGVTFTAILPDGQEIRLASGLADSVNKARMQPDQRMLSGSIGKTFFVAAVLHLVEQGKFGLDDPISKYLGSESWFSRIPNAHAVTIRMLMNHTSGIEEYYQLGDFMHRLKNDPYRQWKPLELFSYVFDRKPLFEAGAGWGYSDTNYLILGYLVEKVTGNKMYDLAKKYALNPYKLKATEPSLKFTFNRLAVGYSRAGSPFPFPGPIVKENKLVFNPEFEWTGGGFVSSSYDLAKWAKAFYTLKTVSEPTRQAMRDGIKANTGKDHRYGLGMQIKPSEAGFGYGHSGWFPGYISECAYFPEMGLAVAIQFNTDDTRLLKKSSYAYLVELVKVIEKDAVSSNF
ncbi:MAG TPA: serine hydrolase domain-containing protein [Daejeonella sp.]|nr:serine hydrolase domain-containing protein [Daejeonella sp.]